MADPLLEPQNGVAATIGGAVVAGFALLSRTIGLKSLRRGMKDLQEKVEEIEAKVEERHRENAMAIEARARAELSTASAIQASLSNITATVARLEERTASVQRSNEKIGDQVQDIQNRMMDGNGK